MKTNNLFMKKIKGYIMKNDEYHENLLKEIDLIQNIINRMAKNSFLIKGWAVTLISVIIVFSGNIFRFYYCSLILIGFWALDAYYLYIERRYRELYKWVIKNRKNNSDFLFDLDTYRKGLINECSVILYFKSLMSKTMLLFYCLLAIILLIIPILAKF